ncbi:hypothetical protein BC829DRAFT_226726 [Chytridium lagenaria]|nr:hypothetical protein BC829DRAFT_226726 [Chytridium lagenaria]
MPSQPDPTIQKMFDHDQPRRASAAGLLTHPHDPNSGYYDPNYNAYASPQAAQLRDRSGSIPNTGTYYAPGVGNGPGGIHYSQLPTQDANYGTSSSGYLTDQPYRQSLAQPHNPSTTTPYRPSTAPTRVSSPPPSTRRPSDPTFPPPSSTVNPHKRSQRYCCGCFRTRGGCCAFWWILVLLFLAGAGVAVFFFFPRAPIVVVGQPYVNPGTTGLKTSGDLATASVAKPFIIEFDLRTDVSIFSPNRVNVKVDKLTFVGTLLDAARKKLNARANGQANSVTFKSNANTTFTLVSPPLSSIRISLPYQQTHTPLFSSPSHSPTLSQRPPHSSPLFPTLSLRFSTNPAWRLAVNRIFG